MGTPWTCMSGSVSFAEHERILPPGPMDASAYARLECQWHSTRPAWNTILARLRDPPDCMSTGNDFDITDTIYFRGTYTNPDELVSICDPLLGSIIYMHGYVKINDLPDHTRPGPARLAHECNQHHSKHVVGLYVVQTENACEVYDARACPHPSTHVRTRTMQGLLHMCLPMRTCNR
jgi:hypothetical protein